MFNTVLVANRGEIALRIIYTLQEHNIRTIVTASDTDLNSIPANKAEEILFLPGTTALETYLNMDLIISKAKDMGVQAIHPGYGFLAENPVFAESVDKAGMTFIGPSPEQMRIFGDKIQARELAIKTETPLVKGTDGNLSDDELKEIAKDIGYPILIKAAAGGGGRGIRLVEDEKEFDSELEQARKESKIAFDDSRLFVEKFIKNARHIEIQVLGNSTGDILHFGERDCTLQRKNQKLIEEAPAPTISREKAEEITNIALNLTNEIGYQNAGTVEFLLDNGSHDFYFLEVNARIQVEHPVTEFVTGEDLIWRQLQVAAGLDLELTQSEISIKGHAIESRIYSENPYNNFQPSTGMIKKIRHPIGSGIRVDSAFQDSDLITPFFDPMISKLIVYAPNRNAAIRKLSRALDDYLISGVHTTTAYIRDLVNSKEFLGGNYHTGYLDQFEAEIPFELKLVARAVAGKTYLGRRNRKYDSTVSSVSKWSTSTWLGGIS